MIFAREVAATRARNFVQCFNVLDAFTRPSQKIHDNHHRHGANGDEGKQGVKSHSV